MEPRLDESPFFGTHRDGGHGFTAVAHRVKPLQTRLQRQTILGQRLNHHPALLHTDANLLIGMQMRRPGDRLRQANPQTVTR